MMMPAWVPRLKDLKAMKSKKKQSKSLFFSTSSMSVSKSLDLDACMCFMKALSLQRANVTARCTCLLEGRLGYLSNSDSMFSSIDNDARMCMQPPVYTSADADAVTTKLCSYGGAETFNEAGLPFHNVDGNDFAGNVRLARSSCGTEVGPHVYEGKERMASCAQNDLYGAIENDAESSNLLTPNTIESSFGSETSSAESSAVSKCGYADKRQRLMLCQEGDCSRSHLEGGEDEEPVYPEEAPFFTNWSDIGSSEDLQSACSLHMQDISRLSFCDRGLNSSKLVESSSENCINARRLDIEALLRLTYNEGHLNLQKERNSHNLAAGSHSSLPSFQGCHTRASHASQTLPGSVFSMRYEGSPRFANSYFNPVFMQKESIKSRSVSKVGFKMGNLQKGNCSKATGNCMKDPCEASDTPKFCLERSNFEGAAMLGNLLCSEWEETSALIAGENPGLMMSSKWHESSYRPQSQAASKVSAGTNRDLDMSARLDQENRSGAFTCVPQDNTVGLSVCAQQCNTIGPRSACSGHNDSDVGCHKSLHDAYLRRGRRCRGSSFSAALPEDLQGVVGDSIALVKWSHDPYEDFRHSMYEMIMEKDLEEFMDVEELLYCYLSLNSPEHHELIEEVFSDVWSSILMSVR